MGPCNETRKGMRNEGGGFLFRFVSSNVSCRPDEDGARNISYLPPGQRAREARDFPAGGWCARDGVTTRQPGFGAFSEPASRLVTIKAPTRSSRTCVALEKHARGVTLSLALQTPPSPF